MPATTILATTKAVVIEPLRINDDPDSFSDNSLSSPNIRAFRDTKWRSRITPSHLSATMIFLVKTVPVAHWQNPTVRLKTGKTSFSNLVVPRLVEDHKHHVEFLKKVPQLVQAGLVKSLPIKLWEGGLEAIPDGLQWIREGNVSAQKIMYRV